MADTKNQIIRRFIRPITDYEEGGLYFSQIIPLNSQAYAIYDDGLRYVLGDGQHTYIQIRDGKSSIESSKEFRVVEDELIKELKSSIDNINNALNDEVTRAKNAEQQLSSDKADSEDVYTKTEINESLKDVVRYKDAISSGVAQKNIVLKNHSNLLGTTTTEGEYGLDREYEYNLAMVSKWNVADFGTTNLHMNLNTKDTVTINDKDIVATENSVDEKLEGKVDWVAGKAVTTEKDIHRIELAQEDQITAGGKTLAFMNSWGVMDFGSVDAHTNINTSTYALTDDKLTGVVTINDKAGIITDRLLPKILVKGSPEVTIGSSEVQINGFSSLATTVAVDLSDYAKTTKVENDLEQLKDTISEKISDLEKSCANDYETKEDAKKEEEIFSKAISEINEKIPAQASNENKLADKDFVNSSIQNMAANRVYADNNQGYFATRAKLKSATVFYNGKGEQYIPTNNDYTIVLSDEDAPKPYTKGQTRWIYSNEGVWEYNYGINTTFTSDQQKALDSGITEDLVNQINTNEQELTEFKSEVDEKLEDTLSLSETNKQSLNGALSVPELSVGEDYKLSVIESSDYMVISGDIDFVSDIKFDSAPTTTDETSYIEASDKTLVNKKQVQEALDPYATIEALNTEIKNLKQQITDVKALIPTEVYTMAEAKSAFAKEGKVTLCSDVALNIDKDRIVTAITAKNKTSINLNRYDIVGSRATDAPSTYPMFLFKGSVNYTFNGEGLVEDKTLNSSCLYTQSKTAEVTINGGTWVASHSEVIYCEQGKITINGGEFKTTSSDKRYVLNCKDANFTNEMAKIIVTGGKFWDFNPADNPEGDNTSYVAEGYKVISEQVDEHTVYSVVKA